MPEFSPVILLSRPRAQAEAFADDLRKRFGEDLRIEISPILEIEFLSPEVTLPVVAAYVFTSRNAVLAWEASGMACQGTAYCVGNRTANAAAKIGFSAISAGGDVNALIKLIKKENIQEPLIYPRGENVKVDLKSALAKTGHSVTDCIVYRQKKVALDPLIESRLRSEKHLIIPVFSPLSAKWLSQSLVSLPSQATVVALSPDIAGAWERTDDISVAKYPDSSHMIAQIATILSPASP